MTIRVAIVGVGNCASSLVQAVEAAKKGTLGDAGVSHSLIGKYAVYDIEFVAAFDIDARKVSKDLSEAIFSEPNCTTRYYNVEHKNVKVSCGSLKDGIATHMNEMIFPVSESEQSNLQQVVDILKRTKGEVVVSYLPVGSQQASEFYAQAALQAGCAFINCTPSLIACSQDWADKYANAGLPLLGDDIKSQVGSTAIHRALIDVLTKKGIQISRMYQLNIGGNTDFMNMRYPERASSKKASKERSISSMFSIAPQLSIGPSDYAPHLKDHKIGYINIEGKGLMGMPLRIELKLEVEDSPNSTGVVINAIRSTKLALDRKLGGQLHDVCPWLFKSSPEPQSEITAFETFEQFVNVS